MMRNWGYPYGQYHMGYSGFWGGGIVELVLMVIFWGAVIFLFIALIKGLMGSRHNREWHEHHHEGHGRHEEDYEEEESQDALDILKTRYAKGEITKKTFEEMKKDIL